MIILTRPALIAALLAFSFPVFAGDTETALGNETRITAARAAVKELAGGLKKHLKAALKSDGPMGAIGVCNTIASALTQSQSERGPLTIRRTALKLRNPNNAPDDFERRVLEMFVAKIESGSPASTLEHSEVVVSDGKKLFRYMKAIPTAQKPCLACHGSNLQPELQKRILELYPKDKATGFQAGELRGAFSVTQTIE